MAEEAKGITTSEFKLSAAVILVGTVIDFISIGLATLRDQGVHGAWLTGALAICGTLMVIATALGYARSRVLVKLAGQAPAATQAVRDEVVPLAGTLRELVEELRAARAKDVTPPPETLQTSSTRPPA